MTMSTIQLSISNWKDIRNRTRSLSEKINLLPSVASHKWDKEKESLHLTLESASYLNDVIHFLKKEGILIPTQEEQVTVLEMACAACASGVEKALKKQTGVLSADVNYATQNAQIQYISEIISPERMKEAVVAAGYDLAFTKSASEKQVIIEEVHNKKLKQVKQNLLWSALFTLPVFVIGMFFMNISYANEIMWVLSTPVVFIFGKDFFINAWKQFRNKSANMDTLVALGSGIAYVFSVFNTLFPNYWHQRGIHAHVYFEAAAVIITFILLGKYLEERAKHNTSTALKKLIQLQPDHVQVMRNGDWMTIPVGNIQIDDILLAKPGERIAVDGTVTDGSSFVDESLLSGEPVPVQKEKSAMVYSGTINQKGSLYYQAKKVGADTVLSQIIQMVQEAQSSKAPIQKLVDKIAGIFVPIVIIISILAFILWNIFGGTDGFTYGLMAMATVLVIACPCALGLATPTAIMVGIGKGAEKGILIKNASSLELAKKIDTIILDKTGTITQGKPVVTDSYWVEENEINKAILYAIESQSEHPLAKALTDAFPVNKALSVSAFESLTGMGAGAVVEDNKYYIGNRRLLYSKNILIDEKQTDREQKWLSEAKTVVWFSNSKTVIGIFAISDEVKPNSKEAIHKLKNSGIKVVMLTGDNEASAKEIARQTEIDEFVAESLPEDKLNYVKKLQSQGQVIAMVGDGINDSAALAQADVSIAMGQGSDIARETAQIIIISSDLNKIPEAIKLSKQTTQTIRQNLFWAFIYNIIGIPVAAGILYPINGFLLDPMWAGAAMALSSVSVVSNSLLLKMKK